MTEQNLKNLIAIIENPNYVVMWNDGSDKFYLLKNKVHYGNGDEARVFFQGFKNKYIEVYNTTVQDFKFFGKEKETTKILDKMDKEQNKLELVEIDGEEHYTTTLSTLKKKTTCRGFGLYEFKDKYGRECSLQDSSLASESAIWFGVDNADPKILVEGKGWTSFDFPDDVLFTTRMHLTQEQVKALLPILTHFAETGEYIRDYEEKI